MLKTEFYEFELQPGLQLAKQISANKSQYHVKSTTSQKSTKILSDASLICIVATGGGCVGGVSGGTRNFYKCVRKIRMDNLSKEIKIKIFINYSVNLLNVYLYQKFWDHPGRFFPDLNNIFRHLGMGIFKPYFHVRLCTKKLRE